LAGLVESGYLYRTNEKSYFIGPTLVAIGRVANEHFSPLQVAQPEMRALADEFDAICSVFYREGDAVVVRARAAAMSQLGWSVPQGTRMQLRAPFVGMWFAWAPKAQAEAEAWLDSMEPSLKQEQRHAMLASMTFLRKHRFTVGIHNLRVPASPLSAPELFSVERSEYPVVTVARIEPDQSYPLASVLAPVFDAQRQVAFALGLMGFTGSLSGVQVEKMGQRLREACDRITSFIGGKPPL
jgi:DNA-binding IclR family transcriptional regulator